MFDLITNAAEQLQQELLRLQALELLQPTMLADAAQESRDAVAARIQNRGENTAGQPMETSHARRIGVYSSGWGSQRQKKGLQTSRMDFTFSGDLMENWSVLLTGNSVALGFFTDDAARKADELERQFGEAFGLRDDELKPPTDRYFDRANQLLL